MRDAIDNGLAYATEDRKTNGLILSDTIAKIQQWHVWKKLQTNKALSILQKKIK